MNFGRYKVTIVSCYTCQQSPHRRGRQPSDLTLSPRKPSTVRHMALVASPSSQSMLDHSDPVQFPKFIIHKQWLI